MATARSENGRFLSMISHPDGDISFFNDAAFGIAPANAKLFDYAERLGVPSQSPTARIGESGYVRLEHDEAVVIADVAPIGPTYLPGHAHADTLSFEMSLFGARLFVNSGVSLYGATPERHRQRGTSAHNTVTIADANSSDVWSGFRVGARARVSEAAATFGKAVKTARGTHDGYRALPGSPTHTREWTLTSGRFLVEDQISSCLHTARSSLSFASRGHCYA